MKFCSQCGKLMDDLDTVCANCGQVWASVEEEAPVRQEEVQEVPIENDVPLEEPVFYAPQEAAPMMSESYFYEMPAQPEIPAPKKKLKWWMIAVPAVLVIAIAVVLLWNPLMLRFAPEMVIAKAFTEVSAEISERNQGSPLLAVANAVDENGSYTMDFAMSVTPEASSDAVVFDMGLLWEGDTLERQLNFYMAQSGEHLDASIYVDSEKLALSSERLLKDEAFGITYATFSEDIRGNELFADMDEETLSALEEYVEMLQKANAGIGQQTNFAEEFAAVLTDFAASLEPVVASEKRSVLGVERKTDTVAYTVTYQDLARVLEDILEIMEMDATIQNQFAYSVGEGFWDEFVAECDYMIDAWNDTEGSVIVTFWLYRNDLVCISMDMTGEYEGESFACYLDIELGQDPSVNDIIYHLTVVENDGAEVVIDAVHSTVKDVHSYAETLDFSVTDAGETASTEISYEWNRDSGMLSVAVVADDAEIQFELGLEAGEKGFTLFVDDLYGLLADAGIEDAAYYDGILFSLEMSMYQGADVTVPEFKNIDQWTQGDILNLALEFQSLGT